MKKKPEFFYRDKNGKPDDKGLHEPILAGDHEAAVEISRQLAREQGMDEAMIAQLWPRND